MNAVDLMAVISPVDSVKLSIVRKYSRYHILVKLKETKVIETVVEGGLWKSVQTCGYVDQPVSPPCIISMGHA